MIDKVYENFDLDHTDFHPWNIVVQGRSIQLIDNDHRDCGIVEKFSNLCVTIYQLKNTKKGHFLWTGASKPIEGGKLPGNALAAFRAAKLL